MIRKIFLAILALSVITPANCHAADVINLNGFDSPGTPNAHYNSGARRITRVGETLVALANVGAADYTYRSIDNGDTWTRIDTDGSYSGTLIQDSEDNIYHFYRTGTSVYMVKFAIDATTIPAPVSVFTDTNYGTTVTGVYRILVADVDGDDNIFIATHWQPDSNEDSVYMLKSTNGGTSFASTLIDSGLPTVARAVPSIAVGYANTVHMAWSEHFDGSESMRYSRSTDAGVTWSTPVEMGADVYYNPSILPAKSGVIYLFAQHKGSASDRALVFKKSTDDGATWGDWVQIDGTSLSGYGDPQATLASNGNIYVSYRSGARPDLSTTYGGAGCRERVALSDDGGDTWTFPWDWFTDDSAALTERTGARSSTRNQVWHQDGGPLDMLWLQEENSGTVTTTYYMRDSSVTLADTTEDITISFSGSGFTIQ